MCRKVSRVNLIRRERGQLACSAWRRLRADLTAGYTFLMRGSGCADLSLDTAKWNEAALQVEIEY